MIYEFDDLPVLQKMREILTSPAAWHKGAYFAGQCYCLHGACIRALWELRGNAPEDFGIKAVKNYYHDELNKTLFPDNYRDAAAWNDRPERTHAEVLALLDTRIAELSNA